MGGPKICNDGYGHVKNGFYGVAGQNKINLLVEYCIVLYY